MKISVIIPAYNHEKYIGASIESVLGQTLKDFELIIINDGSTDNTEREILKYDDSRINYLSQENSGTHNTINKGIAMARGEYISILNSDDIYHRDRLELCLKSLEDHKATSVVITQVEGITGDGAPVTDQKTPQITAWLDWYKDALKLYETRNFLLSAFAKNILVTTSNYFMTKAVFQKVGGFIALRYTHDWDMLLRLAQFCEIHLMREVLLQYRIHQSNTVLEDDSEAKVKFEVNWLIARNIRQLTKDVDLLQLMDSIKKNHYIVSDVLTLLLMINDASKAEVLLNFKHPITVEMLKLIE
jgi:glycosyltransferase involved in cell wall biosynthesis